MNNKTKICLDCWTEFECEKCGHRESTHDENGEAKEWLNHCGATSKMIMLRKLNAYESTPKEEQLDRLKIRSEK